jgi:hypothetical protein
MSTSTTTARPAVVVVLALTAALATELTLAASRRGTPAASATAGARQPINPPEGAHQ